MSEQEKEILDRFDALSERFDKFIKNKLKLTDDEFAMLKRGVCPDCLQKNGEHLHSCRFRHSATASEGGEEDGV